MSFARLLLSLVIGFLILQRLAELAWARRNEKWIRQRGGQEFGAGRYPWIVALHAGFLFSLAVEAWHRDELNLRWPVVLALLFIIQAGRYWCLTSLGSYWNTKILVIPGSQPVRRGPYRWLKHPNYAIVVLELALYPALFQAWWTLLWVFVINLFLLRIRIREENRAIALCSAA